MKLEAKRMVNIHVQRYILILLYVLNIRHWTVSDNILSHAINSSNPQNKIALINLVTGGHALPEEENLLLPEEYSLFVA